MFEKKHRLKNVTKAKVAFSLARKKNIDVKTTRTNTKSHSCGANKSI